MSLTGVDWSNLAQAIDHTQLMFANDEDPKTTIKQLCAQAKQAGFAAVCVRPAFVRLAIACLAASSLNPEPKIQVATVIGFPTEKLLLTAEQACPTVGAVSLSQKLAEVKQALADGATELDVVLNVGLFQAEFNINPEQQPKTQAELETLINTAQAVPIKLIIETDLLTTAQIKAITQLAARCGVAMIKTSTGMLAGGRGATVEAVTLIRQILEALQACGELKHVVGIKASGGIQTREQAMALLAAGATRLGTSQGLSLL